MTDDYLQTQIEDAVRSGERNLAAIAMVRDHCSHADVSKSPFGGTGMIEMETGLPIGLHRIRCEYAAASTYDSPNVERMALDFWESNCQGCEHRDPRAFPNLATLGERRLGERAESEQQEAELRAQRDEERQERAAERRRRVAAEPPATRAFIALLDGIDTEVPDQRAKGFVDESLAAPERCTTVAAQVILDLARELQSESLLRALDRLEQADRVPPADLASVALVVLGRMPSPAAAAIVVRLREHIGEGELKPCLGSLVVLGGRSDEPFASHEPFYAGLQLAADFEPEALIGELSDQLRMEGSLSRGRVAYAAQALVDLLPESASALIEPLVDAASFEDAMSPYMGSSRPGIRAGLFAALRAKPEAISEYFDERIPGLSSSQREAIFDAYDSVFRDPYEGEIASDLAAIALDGVFGRVSGDWGEDLRDSAIETLGIVAQRMPRLLGDRVDAVFGLMLAEVATDVTASTTGPVLLTPPSPLQALEQTSAEWSRRARISKLRDIVAALARLRPEETLAAVEAALETLALEGQTSTDELQSQLIGLLGAIGQRAEFGARVLPRLVTASLSQNVVLRTSAIEALGAVGSVSNRQLPDDVLALLKIWLRDPYRGPHTAAVRAMRDGFPVADESVVDVLLALINLIEAYVSEGESTDFMYELIVEAWRLSLRCEVSLRTAAQRRCLERSERLSVYELERFLVRGPVRSSGANTIIRGKRILQLLGSEERILDPNLRSKSLKRDLTELPVADVAELSTEIVDTARAVAQHSPISALDFVEILQRANLWAEAAALSAEIFEAIPDTPEDRGRRATAKAVKAASEVEACVARGAFSEADVAIREWRDANETVVEFEAAQDMPWES